MKFLQRAGLLGCLLVAAVASPALGESVVSLYAGLNDDSLALEAEVEIARDLSLLVLGRVVPNGYIYSVGGRYFFSDYPQKFFVSAYYGTRAQGGHNSGWYSVNVGLGVPVGLASRIVAMIGVEDGWGEPGVSIGYGFRL